MPIEISLSKSAQKDLKRAPQYIQELFTIWFNTIIEDGYLSIQKKNGYRDHALIGNRKGQRSSSLNRSWRVIYKFDTKTTNIKILVLEVNKHDY